MTVARWAWAQLTSMKTALVLLFLLAIAAIPGSILPQRSVSPISVIDYKKANPNLDRFFEPLGFYDVYASPWFSAVYILLFVSLIGCIIPRIGVYAHALRTWPAPPSARLAKAPKAIRVQTTDDHALASLAAQLRRRRWRVACTDSTLSAEIGYSREAGNLVFHIGLVFVLAGIAWSGLAGFRGSAIVVEGQGFSNTITQYDEFTSGALANTQGLSPFTIRLDRFLATFEKGAVQRGAARSFSADVTLTESGTSTPHRLEVNRPLEVSGAMVHLISHGYAAQVKVTDGAGNTAFRGPVVFLPQDGNFTSVGVIKVPDARPNRLAFQGFFLPTGVIDDQGPRSLFPDTLHPQLVLSAWSGPPAKESGRPANVYTLDTSGLTQLAKDGQAQRILLRPGESAALQEGLGTITFEGVSRWTKLQVSASPGVLGALIALVISILGISISLFVRPRRILVRRDEDALVLVGIDKRDATASMTEEISDLLASCGLSEPKPEESPS